MNKYMINYEEAVEYLYRIPRFNSKHSLAKISMFLTKMGQPDKNMKIIHVAGTNGKGSTCAYLSELLQGAGMKTGLFTSPHLVDVRERFRVNGRMIGKTQFARIVQKILSLMDEEEDYEPCLFDMYFFIGMEFFKEEQVEVLILETGLGGTMDATNSVSHKELTLITHIDFDHTEYLGDTLEQIAEEKAGIMFPHTPCIVGAGNDSVCQVFLRKAGKLGSNCRVLKNVDYGCQRVSEKAVAFSYFSRYYGNVPITLSTLGIYQVENVSLALAGMEALIEQGIITREALSKEKISELLRDVIWEGRMEEAGHNVFLDGAHNVDGIRAFLKSVPEDGCKGRRKLIFSAVSDKEYEKMLGMILETSLFDEIILTHIKGDRGVSVDMLQVALAKTGCRILSCCMEDLQGAIHYACINRTCNDYVYIVGSLYLVGQAKNILNDHEVFSQ